MVDRNQSDVAGLTKMKPTGDGQFSIAVTPVGEDGRPFVGKNTYTLLNAAVASGAWVGPIAGGLYAWRCECANFGGVTATLKFMGLDGVTEFALKDDSAADVTFAASGQTRIDIAQGAYVKVALSGVPTAPINSAIGAL